MKKLFFSKIPDFLQQLFITLFVLSLVFTYCLRIIRINGDSMRDTLCSDDRVIMTMFCGKPKKGDIVVIRADDAVTLDEKGAPVVSEGLGKIIVKRIIACEGQTVDIDFAAGAVYVDGKRIYEEYVTLGLTHIDDGAFAGQYPVTVPEGHVFVMGDDRSVSKDSRSPDIGFVPADDIEGRVVMKIHPNFKWFE